MRTGSDWPAGEYEAQRIMSAGPRSAQTGNVGLEVAFEVDGHRVCVTFWLSEKAFERSQRQLTSLGFNGDFENPQFSATGPFVLSLRHEMYKDKLQPQWNLASGADRPDPAKLAIVSQRFKAASRTSSGPPPAPRVPTTPPAPPAPKPKPQAAPRESKPRTRDAAWQQFNTIYAGEATEQWNKAIAAVSSQIGKTEEAFTEADYGKVFDMATSDIPF
jgi:hypothetical protein